MNIHNQIPTGIPINNLLAIVKMLMQIINTAIRATTPTTLESQLGIVNYLK